MLDEIRKKMESGIGSISGQSPDEIGAAMLGKAKEAAEQLSGLAAGMLEWSAAARERMMGDVGDLVHRVVDEMGLATRKEVEALGERVARLEKKAAPSRRQTAPAKATAKRTTTSTAKRSSRASSSARSPRSSSGR